MGVIRSWREQKVMLKWRFPVLRDEDLFYESGDRESMLKRLESKLKKTRDELELIFAELQHF